MSNNKKMTSCSSHKLKKINEKPNRTTLGELVEQFYKEKRNVKLKKVRPMTSITNTTKITVTMQREGPSERENVVSPRVA